jgi:small nuclear ribonucleoprotein (snRNP)-like protein
MSLDFFSEAFDPLLALYSSVSPPLPQAELRDNISRCRSLLPPDDPLYVPERQRVKPTAAAAAAAPVAAEARAKQKGPPVIERFTTAPHIPRALIGPSPSAASVAGGGAAAAAGFVRAGSAVGTGGRKEGPLALLKKLFAERHRVRIVLRRTHGIRGHCDGLLLAFDKHCNMVLLDVDETYREQGDHHGRVRQRHLKQVFVRGEHVVLVGTAPRAPAGRAEAGSASATAMAAAATADASGAKGGALRLADSAKKGIS